MAREDFDINIRAGYAGQGAFGALRRDLTGAQGALAALAGGLGGLGAGLSAAGVIAFSKSAVDALGSIAETADRVGVSTDALQALRFELKQSGADAALAERGLTKFAQVMASAGKSGDVLTRVLKDNGVSFRNTDGSLKSAEQGLEIYARLVAGATSQQDKLALASEAFSMRAGPKQVAMLERIAQVGLQGVIDKAKEAGQVAEESMTRSADAIGDRWDAMIDRIILKLQELAVDGIPLVEKAAGVIGSKIAGIFTNIGQIGRLAEANRSGFRSAKEMDSYFDMESKRGGGDAISRFWAQNPQLTQFPELPNMSFGRPTNTNALRAGGGPSTAEKTREVIELLKLEGDQLTLNVAQRRAAEQAEQEIMMIKRAGVAEGSKEAEQIRGAVAALHQKKAAFDELKRQQEGLNDALRAGGDQLVSSLDGLITKTKTWKDVLADAVNMLRQAALRATIMGEGPLAGLLGMKGEGGAAGGLLGGLFGGFRADGGSVAAGRAYVVGERRPELFIPDVPGRIESGVKGGGRSIVVGGNTYHFAAGVSGNDRAMIRADIERITSQRQVETIHLLREGLRNDLNFLQRGGH